MNSNKIIISGTGCALADFLYTNISFDTPSFRKYLSKTAGDGGLSPGKLVFTEELERYSGCEYKKILKEITGNKSPAGFNIGGPSLVSLIHASQLLGTREYEVKYFGMAGKDDTAEKIFSIATRTPLNINDFKSDSKAATPFTDVFSDPFYDNGHGERTFVNNIGAAWHYTPGYLSDDFYDSGIVCFGGTALVPQIHDDLSSLLAMAKKRNCITLVNTVFDFRNEKNNPGKPWPLGDGKDSFNLIDILLMDSEESLKISGQKTIQEAATFFIRANVSSFIITNGVNNVLAWSGGKLFEKSGLIELPVSQKVINDLNTKPELKGDTTGCGDNFAGGIIASIAWQMRHKSPGRFNLIEAVSWGISSGGFSCYVLGGTYLEKYPGEKLNRVFEIQKEYLHQIRY
jgi:sugar/nucleoside kinase (ribokinase family)